jgi:hypothetical protein
MNFQILPYLHVKGFRYPNDQQPGDRGLREGGDEMRDILFSPAIAIAAAMGLGGPSFAMASHVSQENGKTYIVDQRSERWDVTQAASLGFEPEGFQYGIGRNAFTPLDDSRLQKGDGQIPPWTRVIGVPGGSPPRAYSVKTLWSHEIANSNLGEKPVAVGY